MRMKALIGIALMTTLLMGAGGSCTPTTSGSVEQQAQEKSQMNLIQAYPAPQLAYSGERLNLIKRLKRLNTENMSGYVYLLTQQGAVVAFYPINGKVTSLNAYLSGDTKPNYFREPSSLPDPGWQMTESPDYDGAYGKNSDGIFFFTADTDAYVEWHGDYLFSDAPLQLSQPPLAVRQISK